MKGFKLSIRIGVLLILPLCIASTACKKQNRDFVLGEEVKIPFGKTATLRDNGAEIKFEFTELLEDSRCKGTCIWAGRRVIALTVDDTARFELGQGDLTSSTVDPIAESAQFLDYTIRLVGVGGKSRSRQPQDANYTIHLVVEE